MNERRIRIGIIMAIAIFAGVLVVGKLLYVQVFANEKYSNASIRNRLQEVEVVPDRGIIYDRNGEALAISVKRDSVFITPSEIRNLKDKDKVISSLSESLGLSKGEVEKAVNTEGTDFVWVKRHADKKDTDKLKKENFRGVGFISEYNREYPKGRLASQVIGFAGIDNQGLDGAELRFNNVLAGNPGKLIVEYDGKGNTIPQSIRESIPASAGNNVFLTLDGTIQYIVERELAKAQEKYKPLQITCIVQEVKTGKILAMASLPDFDPNEYEKSNSDAWKNLAISKVYEPGSVFKVFSTSMYLEDDVATPDSQYYCPGFIMIDGHQLRCWTYPDAQGAETLKQGLADSCNIVQAKSVARLGKDRFFDYINGFGFTRKTGIDLPAESAPVLVPKDKVVPLDLAAMSIGQANAYTPIQMINALSAVANGGQLLKPQIVEKETDRNGRVISEAKTDVVRRVISEHSAAQMRDMLEYVVTNGLGKNAAVPGYRVAGKTGTAEIARGGKYEKGDYNLSFGGFAPANDPRISCIVIVNSPQTNASSGTVAGPIFSAIVGDIMRYYEIPSSEPSKTIEEPTQKNLVTVPDLKLPMNAEEARLAFQNAGLQVKFVTQGNMLKSYLPAGGAKAAVGSTIDAYAQYDGQQELTLPDFTGKTIKEVDRVLSGFGLVGKLDGSGLAWKQTPAAESKVSVGSTVTVTFVSTFEREGIEADQKAQKEKERKDAEAAKNDAAADQKQAGDNPPAG